MLGEQARAKLRHQLTGVTCMLAAGIDGNSSAGIAILAKAAVYHRLFDFQGADGDFDAGQIGIHTTEDDIAGGEA